MPLIIGAMPFRLNPHQLVLRLDSATGFARVGWAAELPIGRFIHVQLLAETPHCGPISPTDPLFDVYNQGCERAREINRPLIVAENQRLRAENCLPVAMNLNAPSALTAADAFGCYRESAMRALFRLTANFAAVWAVINGDAVEQLHSRRPIREMDELEYQVWKSQVFKQLSDYPGEITAGKLLVRDSGLWFCALATD